jgi:hypothetical protein
MVLVGKVIPRTERPPNSGGLFSSAEVATPRASVAPGEFAGAIDLALGTSVDCLARGAEPLARHDGLKVPHFHWLHFRSGTRDEVERACTDGSNPGNAALRNQKAAPAIRRRPTPSSGWPTPGSARTSRPACLETPEIPFCRRPAPRYGFAALPRRATGNSRHDHERGALRRHRTSPAGPARRSVAMLPASLPGIAGRLPTRSELMVQKAP